MTTWIDPPSGWRWGFPKVYHNPDELSIEEWLVENGYPQWEIDNADVVIDRFIYDDEREVKRGI